MRRHKGINAADSCIKMGDVWYANYISIKLFSLKKQSDTSHPLPIGRIQSHTPSGRKLTSQHGGRAVLQEPPLHRRRDCRTCSPGRQKVAAGRRKAGLSSTSWPAAP